MISVPLYQGRTIHHDIIGKSGAAKVILKRASPGTGVIAGGPLRSIFGLLGLRLLGCARDLLSGIWNIQVTCK